MGPGGGVDLPEPPTAGPIKRGGRGLGTGPEQHPRDRRLRRAQLRAFSKRSAQIEAELEAKGAVYESPALRMQADDDASLATRTAKNHSLTPNLLAERWQREAEQIGLAAGAELDRAVCEADPQLGPPGWDQITAALVDPEVGLCSRSARFTKADVVEHICAISGGRLTAEEITAPADRFVDSDLAVRLTPDTETGRRRPPQWSTAAHRALEDRTVALMDTLAARPVPFISTAAAEAWLANMDAIAAESSRRLHDLGTLAGFSRHGRAERQSVRDKLVTDTERADAARDRHDQLAARVEALRREQDAFEQFEMTESWRHAELPRLRDELDQHWAAVVAACVRADDPLAYGIDKLRRARTTVLADLQNLDAGIPADRSQDFNEARGQLPNVIRAKHDAEQSVADGHSRLEEVGRRRWGRQDREAIARANSQVAFAEKRVEQASGAERDLRDRLASLSHYQENRRQAIAASAPRRKKLETTLAQVDTALELTRPERACALAEDPPPYLVRLLGPTPSSAAGQAVWCHHALRIEAFVDRNDGTSTPSTGWTQETEPARQEIAIADRLFETRDRAVDPVEWANLAGQAAALRKAAHRHLTAQRALDSRMSPFPQARWSPDMDNSAERRGPSSACSREPLLRTRTGRGPSASTGNYSSDQIWLLSAAREQAASRSGHQ